METYKVTKKDLIGDIADFPIEVVQKMIERQIEQNGAADITEFQSIYWGLFIVTGKQIGRAHV